MCMHARTRTRTHCQNSLKSFRACNFMASSTIFQIWKVQQPSFKQFHMKKFKHNLKSSGFSIYTYVKHTSGILKSIRNQCNIRQTIIKKKGGGGRLGVETDKKNNLQHHPNLHKKNHLPKAKTKKKKKRGGGGSWS